MHNRTVKRHHFKCEVNGIESVKVSEQIQGALQGLLGVQMG